ncbi:hypothetical protein BCR44DRAFT_1276705 [Catenaria anguillulae PL171]|uniref:Uncharacterized protein n=1 Tax=Catenaria anguillulae PL171 TaxID=765915 RepID=A0A1Y2H9K7_9FUNG|nr:hypothetical protein BCR44DRAFT_1276705 [Catenaria anguillulae PL171]
MYLVARLVDQYRYLHARSRSRSFARIIHPVVSATISLMFDHDGCQFTNEAMSDTFNASGTPSDLVHGHSVAKFLARRTQLAAPPGRRSVRRLRCRHQVDVRAHAASLAPNQPTTSSRQMDAPRQVALRARSPARLLATSCRRVKEQTWRMIVQLPRAPLATSGQSTIGHLADFETDQLIGLQ